MSTERKFWMRWRVRLGYPVALIYWMLATPSLRSILIGGSITLFGLLVRATAAGYLRKSEQLATSGPYGRTRNPLYFGSSLLAAGFAIAGGSWLAAGVVIVYFAVFYYAVMRNEEEELRDQYGSAFQEYAARVPLFFPHVFDANSTSGAGSGPPAKEFSWVQYRRNREYRAFLGTFAALGLVCLRMWLPIWVPWFRR